VEYIRLNEGSPFVRADIRATTPRLASTVASPSPHGHQDNPRRERFSKKTPDPFVLPLFEMDSDYNVTDYLLYKAGDLRVEWVV